MPLLLFSHFLEFFVVSSVEHYLGLDLRPVPAELKPRDLLVPVLYLSTEVTVFTQDPEATLMVSIDAPEHESAYFPEADGQSFSVG